MRCDSCRLVFDHLHTLPRTVVGFHGCRASFAERLIAGAVTTEEWKASQNDYDWLGEGIYFWEHAPARAWEWACRYKGEAAVVAAEVSLGRCLDLADTMFAGLLRASHAGIMEVYERQGAKLPKNEGREQELRRLDRLVIDQLTEVTDGLRGIHYQTLRGPFEEGEPIYQGGMLPPSRTSRSPSATGVASDR